MEEKSWFPDSYEQSRDRFRRDLARVQALWPEARLRSHPIDGSEGLTVDWIEASPLSAHDRLLVFTLGEHGIEAYIGSAMLQLFLAEFLARLDPMRTGLLIVHAINPWGMKHCRRVNANNVDLNRTFLRDPSQHDPAFNPDYARLASFLNPARPIRRPVADRLSILLRLARQWASLGAKGLRQAVYLGQYGYPRGIYYGGMGPQAETRVAMDLYRAHMPRYAQTVHLDMHTGYGPRYQMSVVNSWMEPRDSRALAREFGYPLVVKATADEFYSIRGDMIDFVCDLQQHEFPDRRLYATSFEFGTYGDSFAAGLRGMRAVIQENQLYWHGASNAAVREQVEHNFRELFWPAEPRWREKAVADARQAMAGILRAEGLVGE